MFILLLIFRVTASYRKYSVKVDFENMKIEKTYQRADLRRLSTESFVNGKAGESTSLLTQWVWYRQEESGEWAEYEAKVTYGVVFMSSS